jgi:hypothetical protein
VLHEEEVTTRVDVTTLAMVAGSSTDQSPRG